ncbi:MAG: hypothetical protein ACRD8Z_05410, partial [Nitrososphaeraceae archaeon]
FARSFVRNRIASLEKDVNHCLQSPYAPFPAMLYCFSTIDLLGALYSGQAGKNTFTSNNSKKYMQEFMNYTSEQASFLTEIFRHKLVHLAQPRAIILDGDGSRVSWQYFHDNSEKHLLVEKTEPVLKIQIKSDWEITINKIFNVGILQLIHDIKDSVEKHNGYLDKLENSDLVRDNFEKALAEIYSSII